MTKELATGGFFFHQKTCLFLPAVKYFCHRRNYGRPNDE